ncbi:MAG TPA: peptidyl-prolyl cis-trans isomerase [Gemmatimonadales bacterium]|nr:peptidyl-prolyl cis-trans isomerase [Gemmatimonadales bacterium]
MMQVFRSFFLKIAAAVFIVLMLGFLFTMVPWDQVRGGSHSNVGEINGVSVPLRSYDQMVRNEVEERQRQGGHTLSAEEIQEVRNEVWDNLIQQQSLEREYRSRDIEVTPDEIATAIAENPLPELVKRPEFQTDGKFDLGKYQRWIRSSGAAQYVPLLEAQYGEQLRQSKLLRVVTGDIFISDAALWQAWKDANEKTTIELAAIVPRNVVPDSAVRMSDDELRQYYEGHNDDFKRPATAYLSYVDILRITDASDSAAALQRALDLRKEILAGSPFEEVAKRESADSVSAKTGGHLGEFAKGAMDPAFERAAFSLPIGTLSEPVLSAFGYHLIKVSKRAGGKVTASHILIPVEITGKHRDQLDARADSLETLAASKLDPAALDTAAKDLGLRLGKANPVQKGSRVQVGVQVIPDAGVWAFQAKVGETSRIIEVSYAYFLFRLDSLQAEGVPPFERVKDAVALAVQNQKKFEVARKIGADLLKRIAEGSTLDQAATALHLPHQQFPAFPRNSPPLPNAKLAGAAFAVPIGKTSGLIDTDEGLYVFRVVKREGADSAEFLKKLDEFRAKQIQLARQDRIRNYLAALKSSAKVTDRREAIYRTDAQAEAEQTRQRS